MFRKLWIIPFLFIFLLASCNQKSDDLTKVHLGEVTRSLFYAPLYVAIEKGFFKDEGIDIELQTTWGGDKTMTALLSDSIDIALVGSETSIYVYAQDSKDYAINFAQLTRTDGTFLVAKNKYEDFTWDDLKGSKFLGQRKGGMPQMVGEYVLKQNGLDPHKDIELDQSIDYANIPNAFVSTDVEFVQLFEPTASVFELEDKGYVITSFGTEVEEIPYTSFMAKRQFINDNEDTIQSFTNAIYKAQKWVQQNSPEEIAKVIEPYFEDTKMDLLVSSINRYKEQGSYAVEPKLSKEGWELLKEIMDEAGELPEDVDYEQLVNTKFAKEAVK